MMLASLYKGYHIIGQENPARTDWRGMEYFRGEAGKAVCLLCGHYCKLKLNQVGICNVNQNVDGEIKNLVYGYPIAINVDPIEKKPLYHFFPLTKAFSIGTAGCNFKCGFCQNWSISQIGKKQLVSDLESGFKKYFSPSKVVELALKYDTQSIAYTYNEPTIFYPYIKDIASLAKKNGLKNIMVSNGFMSKEVINDMHGLIDALNVDLKSFNKQYYKKKLVGDLDVILDNLILMKQLGFWIEITTLVIPTKNDTEEELNQIASFIAQKLGKYTPWHISAFYPDYKENNLPRTPVESLEKAYKIGIKNGLKYVYMGNIGKKYKVDPNKDHGIFA